jgi:hypothetical protein
MTQRKPYAAPAAEPVGVYSDLARGTGSLFFDVLGSTGGSDCLVAVCLVVVIT